MRKRILASLLVLLFVPLSAFAVGIRGKVVDVVDGDTIKVRVGNSIRTVRILGIDTPEKYKTRTGSEECYGKEASTYAALTLSGKTVELETDRTQDTKDVYGRALAHVWVDGKLYQEEAIRSGYGFRYVYKKATKYDLRLKLAESKAKKSNVGVWKSCGGVRKPVQEVVSETKQKVDSVLPVTPAINRNTPSNVAPAVTESPTAPIPVPVPEPTAPFSCSIPKKTCSEMGSRAEAQFYLNTCGIRKLDGDSDGTACESIRN